MKTSLLIAALLALSCSHTRAEEMTATEHRSEAAAHEENARKQRDQYDPGLTVKFPGRGPFVESPSDWTSTYNPTAEHLAAADREMRLAAEHLAAAKNLEAFESAACAEIPTAVRSACPLLASAVTQVRHTAKGVDLVLRPELDGADTNRRLNCHLAYAVAQGFEKPSCPLFVKGMSISLKQGNIISLEGQRPEVAKELQDQARRIFAPPPAVSTNP